MARGPYHALPPGQTHSWGWLRQRRSLGRPQLFCSQTGRRFKGLRYSIAQLGKGLRSGSAQRPKRAGRRSSWPRAQQGGKLSYGGGRNEPLPICTLTCRELFLCSVVVPVLLVRVLPASAALRTLTIRLLAAQVLL